jgi:hypothetical protein
MQRLSTAGSGRAAALAIAMAVASAPVVSGQVPSRIPSDPEAQIFSLIQRVTALEEKLAALTSGTATLRVKAPFLVVDGAGDPILQVLDGQAATRGGDPSGVVIANDPKSGVEALLIHNNAGEPVVLLGATDKGGGIGLNDDQGKTRITMTGLGKLVVTDKEGGSILAVAEDISKEDANIRIGGDEGGYAVEVGDGNGAAILGTDDEGVAELSLLDGQNRERVALNGEGTLQVADATGHDILIVAEDVAGEAAGVEISGGKSGGVLHVSDGSGKPAAGILGNQRAVVVTNSTGKVVAEMLASGTADGLFQAWGEGKMPIAVLGRAPGSAGGIVQISNGQVPVSSILASESGAGRWQLNDASGTPMVEAGVTTAGKGMVRAGPTYRCGSNLGLAAAALGPVANAMAQPDCIIGLTK